MVCYVHSFRDSGMHEKHESKGTGLNFSMKTMNGVFHFFYAL